MNAAAVQYRKLPEFLWYRVYSETFLRLKGGGDITADDLEKFYKIPEEEVARKLQYKFTPANLIP